MNEALLKGPCPLFEPKTVQSILGHSKIQTTLALYA